MAKKSGKPSEDFPDIEKGQNVAKTNVFRFHLCIDKDALTDVPGTSTVESNLVNTYQEISFKNPGQSQVGEDKRGKLTKPGQKGSESLGGGSTQHCCNVCTLF
mmetsp:Transcript_46569/g.34197  ORF Transcript_46569/g.34197 Transcript_46569/m.34197 type:complete len:103 (-) Transcript_46569:45-353(-)